MSPTELRPLNPDAGRRFPLDDLMARLHVESIVDGQEGGQQPGQDPEGLALVAVLLGCSHRTTRRLRAKGLNERQADAYAVAAGLHPLDVWPDWTRTAPGEEDLADLVCTCPVLERRPVGDLCDRCGCSLGRRLRSVS